MGYELLTHYNFQCFLLSFYYAIQQKCEISGYTVLTELPTISFRRHFASEQVDAPAEQSETQNASLEQVETEQTDTPNETAEPQAEASDPQTVASDPKTLESDPQTEIADPPTVQAEQRGDDNAPNEDKQQDKPETSETPREQQSTEQVQPVDEQVIYQCDDISSILYRRVNLLTTSFNICYMYL